MKKHQSLQYMLIFILAQVAWLAILGLWIYRFVSGYTAESTILSPHAPFPERANVAAMVGGLILLVAVSVGMSLLFARLTIQLKITRLYDNFIANMTHELKSPLASIQLYLETLNEKRIPGKKRKEFLGLMMQDTSRLNNLIVSILEIAGLEQKRIAHHFEVAAAEPLIRGLVREAIEQFKLPRNAIRIAGSAACRIVTDRNALKIVFNNLIDNAVKYSTGSARIDVRLGFSPKILWVEFRDQGIGISVTDQKRIFDKFLRLYDPHVPSVKGTGLGLYWVKEIMRLHHGRVSVTSDGENKGSTFRIELPVYRTGEKGRLQDLLKTIRNGQQRPDTERGGNHAPAH